MRTRSLAGLSLACILVSAGVDAQEPIQQTVVVTAAATPVTLGSAIRTVAVLTREQIRLLPVHSVADALRLVSSVDVRSRGERGVQTDFTVRGAGFGEALVLVDGVRLNDPQSGHHNGDIPVPLESIERIEVLLGPGSSLFGADAFGGTINIITRRDVIPASGSIEAGSFGYVGGRGQAGAARGSVRQSFAASAERSDGFTFARDFVRAVVRSDTSIGQDTHVSAAFLSNDFGANGFYGASPSHEWTSQALFAADSRVGTVAGWRLDGIASYRTHGDRFLWDVRVPGVLENRHRTHAVVGSLKASRRRGATATFVAGLEGGADWIRSTNLGDHDVQRLSAFGEWRQTLGARTEIETSLRADRYTEFGAAWNPSFGLGWWATSALRFRGSTGRAFRIPTFTERYYSDPAHLARADLEPETSWSRDAGADLFLRTWQLGATLFSRDDYDVIDWLRPTTADRWRTYNVRKVDSVGVELTARRLLTHGAFVQGGYTGLRVRTSEVAQLSKYVQDVTPHAFVAAGSVALPAGLRAAPRFEFKKRRSGVTDRDATLLDLRVSRRIARWDFRVDMTNLFNDRYQEVLGVDLPGRALTASAVFGSN